MSKWRDNDQRWAFCIDDAWMITPRYYEWEYIAQNESMFMESPHPLGVNLTLSDGEGTAITIFSFYNDMWWNEYSVMGLKATDILSFIKKDGANSKLAIRASIIYQHFKIGCTEDCPCWRLR